jgi:hypothetical protein
MSFITWIKVVAKWVVQECRDVWSALCALKVLHWLFFAGAVAAVLFGFLRQQQAFPTSAPSPFAQVSASVYTSINPSRVLLRAKIEPNASQNDRLNITVKGPHGERDPWLLVITCPRRVPGRVSMQMIGVTPPQSIQVLASVHDVGYRSISLPCVSAAAGQPGAAAPVVLPGEDINLSLPALEQGSVGPSAAADTPLYVVRGTSAGHRIAKIVEFFQAPESSCPAPGATPAPSASAASGPAASPSAGASAVTASAGCYSQLPAGTAATKYSFPASVATSETLEKVSLSGDRIDSMFPPGQITSDDRVIWQGASGLSPSLSASSLAGAENASRDGFFAGLLYGLAAGLFVPFLQGLSESHDSVRKDRRARKGTAEQPLDRLVAE